VLPGSVLRETLAAVSVGIVDGVGLLDLPYVEDSRAEVDMNVVGMGSGRMIEVQGTGEGGSFDRAQLDQLLDLAWTGIHSIVARQREAIEGAGFSLARLLRGRG